MNKALALLVIILGIISLGLGAYFIYQGVSKDNYLLASARQEKFTIGLTQEQISAGQVDVAADQLLKASEKAREDPRNIAPTYNDLLGGKHFEPTDPTQLTYAQTLILKNSLDLPVLSFGISSLRKRLEHS